jgi:hypothetical protein
MLSAPVLVAPLMVPETVWHVEAKLWPATAGLVIERVIGNAKQRLAANTRLMSTLPITTSWTGSSMSSPNKMYDSAYWLLTRRAH